MPHAACALRRAVPLLLVAAICSAPSLGQETARVAARRAKHFATLRFEVDSLDAFHAAGVREFVEACREELDRSEFKGLVIPQLRLPLRLSFALKDDFLRDWLLRVETQDERLVFAPWWEAFLARKAKGRDLPSFPLRELGGVKWTMPMFFRPPGPRAYEGLVDGRVRLSLRKGAPLGDSAALMAPFAKMTIRERRLWEPIKKHTARGLMSLEAVLRSSPREESAKVRLLMGQILGQFTGFSFGWSRKGDLTIAQGFSDFRVGGGLLGSIFHREKKQPRMLAWIPDDISECAALRLDPRGLARALRTFVTLAKVDLEEELGLTLNNVTRIVGELLDGEVGFLSQRTPPDKALDVDADEPFVMMLGTPDATKLIKAIGALDELDKVELFDEPAFVVREENEDSFYFVAKKGVLFVCNSDPVSKRMLQRALATRGQAGIPKCMREKLGPGPFPSDFISATWFSSGMSSEVWRREVRGRELSAMTVRLVRSFLGRIEKRGGLRAATWFRVTRKGSEVYTVH